MLQELDEDDADFEKFRKEATYLHAQASAFLCAHDAIPERDLPSTAPGHSLWRVLGSAGRLRQGPPAKILPQDMNVRLYRFADAAPSISVICAHCWQPPGSASDPNTEDLRKTPIASSPGLRLTAMYSFLGHQGIDLSMCRRCACSLRHTCSMVRQRQRMHVYRMCASCRTLLLAALACA